MCPSKSAFLLQVFPNVPVITWLSIPPLIFLELKFKPLAVNIFKNTYINKLPGNRHKH